MEEKKKNTGMKICIVIMSIIIVLLLSAGAVLFYFAYYEPEKDKVVQNQQTEESLIKVSSQKGPTDDYGIIGEVGILGKQASSVLEQYKKGVDYTEETINGKKVYRFENVEYDIGTLQTLSLYTTDDSSKINLIEYSFFIEGGGFSAYSQLSNLEERITNTYNVDPFYVYKDGTSGYYKKTSQSIEAISWETDSVIVALFFTYYEKDNPMCNLLFENKNK